MYTFPRGRVLAFLRTARGPVAKQRGLPERRIGGNPNAEVLLIPRAVPRQALEALGYRAERACLRRGDGDDGGMDLSVTRDYYEHGSVVDHYAHAAAEIGLWRSEEAVFREVFARGDCLLELGTGTGRIALGLCELGYTRVIGVDISRAMIKRAQRLRKILEYEAAFQVMDACDLKFDDGTFDGAIFGFNGLMQIPGRENRRQALREIQRVLRPGAVFVFTTHDQHAPAYKRVWKEEAKRWAAGKQDRSLLEFGDRYEDTEFGRLFVHVPTGNEVREDLKATGWKCDFDTLRSQIAKEPGDVTEFSDDCRFWIARKPEEAEAAS